MNRTRENDPDRDHNTRTTSSDPLGRSDDDLLEREGEGESDLQRAQSEGNLGNERTRDKNAPRSGRHDGSL